MPVAAVVGNDPNILPANVSNVTPPLNSSSRLSLSFGEVGNVTVIDASNEPAPTITRPVPLLKEMLVVIVCCPSGLNIILVHFIPVSPI